MTKIVVGVDGSDGSNDALDWTLKELDLWDDPTLLLVHTWDYPYSLRGGFTSGGADTLRADAEAVMDLALKRIGRTVATVQTQLKGGSAARALIDASSGADLVVLGARGRGGFASLLLGSVSQQVAEHASCPVVVKRPGAGRTDGPVVVGVDDSDRSMAALTWAAAEAERRRTQLVIVHSYQMPTPIYDISFATIQTLEDNMDAVQKAAEAFAAEQRGTVQALHPSLFVSSEVAAGRAGSILADRAKDAALLVVGTAGRGELGAFVLGSVSREVLTHAAGPVVVVPST